jgi:2-oxoglutarate ferredoxin oxidoreductase subunit alpha
MPLTSLTDTSSDASPKFATDASITLAIVGSGGAGAITTGSLLLEAAGRAGWYGLMSRSVGPQIRGGEALATVRLATTPVSGHGDRCEVLVALDWQNADRFLDEIPLNADSLIIADSQGGTIPAALAASGAWLITRPFAKLAKEIRGGRANLLALGLLGQLLGLPPASLESAVVRTLGRKGLASAAAAAALAAGRTAATDLTLAIPLPPAPPTVIPGQRWLITGNQAAALGALRAGVRFAAVYPITPATDLSEWLAAKLQALGGHLLQAEDEIAAINMVLGASYGGVPALTATSGPGLALMAETLGLAVAAEIPAVVINVMRGGPSTGIPTKSEQTDLNLALYGLHGDAPHLVLAPCSADDCLPVTQWAVHLAEALQCPAIVLSDQFLGQAQTVCDRPADEPVVAPRRLAEPDGDRYDRYALTDDGISPMALPGMPGGHYTAEGLEHNPHGNPSSRAADHLAQLQKRADKLLRFDYGDGWAEIEGDGDIAVLTWGSAGAPVCEAAARARAAGLPVRTLVLRLLSPPQGDRLAAALTGVKRVLVVEQTHAGQFHHYLRAHYDLPGEVRALAQPGPLPLRPQPILDLLLHWH